MITSREGDAMVEAAADAELALVRPADKRTLAATAACAVLMDVAGQSRFPGLAGTILVAATAACLLLSGRLVNRQAQFTSLLVPVFGLWLAVRTSPWLIVPDVLVVAGLLTVAASVAYRGELFDLLLPKAIGRAIHGVLHLLAAPAFILRPLVVLLKDGRRARSIEVMAFIRGLVLAFPIVLTCGLLLGAGDVVFASFFPINIDVDAVTTHTVLLLTGAWGVSGLLRLASARPIALCRHPDRWRLGIVEVSVVLGALDLLFAVFALAQVVAMSGAASTVLRTAGLTYAEYARSGFFQLLWVAAMTLVVLLVVHALVLVTVPWQRVALQVLGAVAALLTLAIVVVAVHRLVMYDTIFGLTMLRLYCIVFAGWIAVVFVILACSFANVATSQHQFLGSAVSAGLVILLVLNMVNPEAFVSGHNLTRPDVGRPIDTTYLGELSDDALPVLIDTLPLVSPATRQEMVGHLCARTRRTQQERTDWLSYNRATRLAAEARRTLC